MNSRERKKQTEPQKNPIIDGDARPDQLDEARINKKLKETEENKGKDKFTSDREADVNSSDDFRDER